MLDKNCKDTSTKEGLTPINLISSVLIGFPFLGVVMIVDLMSHKASFASSLILISLLLSGLALCFFWRRLTRATNRKLLAFAYIVVQWLFMVAYTIIKILEPFRDISTMQNSLQSVGIIANICLGMLIIAALLRSSSIRLQPQALAMTVTGIVLAGILIFSSSRSTDSTSRSLLSLAAKTHPALTPKDTVADSPGFTNIIKAGSPPKIAENPATDAALNKGASADQSVAIPPAGAGVESTHPAAKDHASVQVSAEVAAAPSAPVPASAALLAPAPAPAVAPEPIEAPSPVNSPQQPTEESNRKIQPSADTKPLPWSYAGTTGPIHWGELNNEFKACSTGTMQSPIDIERSKPAKKHFEVVYRSTPLQIIDDGRVLQASIKQGNQLYVGGKNYALKQMIFHTPSEHTISGIVYPLELQLVHTSDDSDIAILSVLVEKGAPNKEIDKILNNWPDDKNVEKDIKNVKINLQKLVPAKKQTFHYVGSLTMPPCMEGVKWYVFKEPLQMSDSQIKTFRSHYDNNARPVQLLDKIHVESKK